MKYQLLIFCTLCLFFYSCKEETTPNELDRKKQTQKRELILKNINTNWDFLATPINTTAETSLTNWPEFRQFLDELAQKPQKSLGAYQKKAIELSKKVDLLPNNIPYQFQQPQIKSRIGALITKVKMLDLYIHLNPIPDKKVIILINEINTHLVSLQRQMDKIIEKSKIPVEEGESDMLQMLDTTRAIPSTPVPLPKDILKTNPLPR